MSLSPPLDTSSLLLGGAISRCSKKHGCVTLSTLEAKYVACFLATQEAIWLMSFLQDLNLTSRVSDPIEIWCNNNFIAQYTKDPKLHRKPKHIKRHYFFVRDAIKLNEVVVKF